MECTNDIDRLAPVFLAVYQSPKPSEEERGRQTIFTHERNGSITYGAMLSCTYMDHVPIHWVSNSDIHIFLSTDTIMSKSEIMLKLAEILEAGNLQYVQVGVNSDSSGIKTDC